MTGTATAPIPMLSEIAAVRLAVTVEVWPAWPGSRDDPPDPDAVTAAVDRARATIRDYFRPIRDALTDDRLDLIDDDAADVVRSDYDGEILAVEGSAHLTVTPAEWEAVADGWCLDLDWTGDGRTRDFARIPALPAGSIAPTLGILDAGGVIPAVAIEGTDQGWGSGGYEPAIIASVYVALALGSEADDA